MERAYNYKCEDQSYINMLLERYGSQSSINVHSSEDLENVIKNAIDRDTGIIDGDYLESHYFPTICSDVFISFSHNDEKLAKTLTKLLESLGLKVFLDSQIWGSADALLNQIDNRYCKNESNNNYNYRKRNFSTSLVHALLSMSLFKVIDKSRVAIFVNTENSLPGIDLMEKNTDRQGTYNNAVTYSPWIYEELMMISTIIKNRQSIFSEGVMHFDQQDYLQMSFKVPTDCLREVDNEWLDNIIKKHLNCGIDMIELLT